MGDHVDTIRRGPRALVFASLQRFAKARGSVVRIPPAPLRLAQTHIWDNCIWCRCAQLL